MIREKILFFKKLKSRYGSTSELLAIFNQEISKNINGFGVLLQYLNEEKLQEIDDFLNMKLEDPATRRGNLDHHNILAPLTNGKYFCSKCNQIVYRVSSKEEADKRIALRQPIVGDDLDVTVEASVCVLQSTELYKTKNLEEQADENEALTL